MHKVSTINLNGRAYQLEDQAYHVLRAYLNQAEVTLAGNPDQDEILSDIEQAVAEKCERALQPGKNVVTAIQMEAILEAMGKVEAAEPAAGRADESRNQQEDSGRSGTGRVKRLFVIREGAMLLGVCQGFAAYTGVDANIIRAIFVVLTFMTSGFMLLIYLVLAFFLPAAKTDADLAEAYGRPVTAQEIVDRARERAPTQESLKRLSDAAIAFGKVVARIASVALYIVFGIVTSVWLWFQGQLLFGNLDFQDSLAFLNGWRQWVFLVSVYTIIALPLFGTARLLRRCAEDKSSVTKQNAAGDTAIGLAWGLAIVAVIGMSMTYAADFRNYANDHEGEVHIGNSSLNLDIPKVCVDQNRCQWDR